MARSEIQGCIDRAKCRLWPDDVKTRELFVNIDTGKVIVNLETGLSKATSLADGNYIFLAPKGKVLYYGSINTQGGIYLGGHGPEQMQIFIPDSTKITCEGTSGLKYLGFKPFKK